MSRIWHVIITPTWAIRQSFHIWTFWNNILIRITTSFQFGWYSPDFLIAGSVLGNPLSPGQTRKIFNLAFTMASLHLFSVEIGWFFWKENFIMSLLCSEPSVAPHSTQRGNLLSVTSETGRSMGLKAKMESSILIWLIWRHVLVACAIGIFCKTRKDGYGKSCK